jgi:hypothetical protein
MKISSLSGICETAVLKLLKRMQKLLRNYLYYYKYGNEEHARCFAKLWENCHKFH